MSELAVNSLEVPFVTVIQLEVALLYFTTYFSTYLFPTFPDLFVTIALTVKGCSKSTCIHELLSVSFGRHPLLEESLDFSAEHQSLKLLEAVNVSLVTVSTKVSLHVEAFPVANHPATISRKIHRCCIPGIMSHP